MPSSPPSRPTAEGEPSPHAPDAASRTPARRSVPQRILDAVLFFAIAVGLVLTVSRFVKSLRTPSSDVAPADLPEPINEAVLSVTGWQVFHKTVSADEPRSNVSRLDRLRALARRAPSIPLPLAADAIETGFQRADLHWTVRERIGNAEIRDTGEVPGTGAVVIHDPADPNGERVLAWYAELPLANGERHVIETIRADLAEGGSAVHRAPASAQ